MFSNLHRSHKTAVDSSYPICPTVRQWQCGAAKFDGKLFLTLDNNILLSSPMFPHCCCPSYRGHPLLVADINFTWEQECGPLASLLATLMAADLYQ